MLVLEKKIPSSNYIPRSFSIYEDVGMIIVSPRIIIPTFEITVRPTFALAEMSVTRYNVLDRARERTLNQIHTQLDWDIFSTLRIDKQEKLKIGFKILKLPPKRAPNMVL